MEDLQIIFLIAMAVVAVVQQVQKAGKQSKTTASRKAVLTDEFPEIMPEVAEEGLPMAPAPSKVRKHKSPKHGMPRSTVSRTGDAPVRPMAPTHTQSSVRLSTREEARRAFIYSEIFRRKY